jgi:hypothetical protein
MQRSVGYLHRKSFAPNIIACKDTYPVGHKADLPKRGPFLDGRRSRSTVAVAAVAEKTEQQDNSRENRDQKHEGNRLDRRGSN